MKARSRKGPRFNLLLLDEGEACFDDYIVQAVTYRTPILPREVSTKATRNLQRGHLRVCSRSLFFEPDDVSLPVIKYPFKHFAEAPEVAAKLLSPATLLKLPAADSKVLQQAFLFRAKSATEMKVKGAVAPYRTVDLKKLPGVPARGGPPVQVIQFLHTPPEKVLPLLQHLHHVAVKSHGVAEEESALAAELHRRHAGTFDMSLLQDFREKSQLREAILVERINPLVASPGRLMVTDRSIYLQPTPINNTGERVFRWDLHDVARVLRRRRLLRPVGMEIIGRSRSSSGSPDGVMLSFQNYRDRDTVFRTVLSQSRLDRREEPDLDDVLARWQAREISNFEYLQFLNSVADRTKRDFTQYPVFPWVIADYASERLDLSDPSTFRDLSKPIGALEPGRLETFRMRFREMPRGEGLPPPFLYGTHYSTPGYVLFFLVRQYPEHMLRLQAGKFDAPDRSFNSIAGCWNSVLKNAADLKELTPEFYDTDAPDAGAFLMNNKRLPLGTRQDGRSVHHVELPPWASSAQDFVRQSRAALESDYVSAHLHEWIDLIFGFKQQGEEAVKADNVFYYTTYEDLVDIDGETNPDARASLLAQVREFGQCPKQLFTSPHPCRRDAPATGTGSRGPRAPGVPKRTVDAPLGAMPGSGGGDGGPSPRPARPWDSGGRPWDDNPPPLVEAAGGAPSQLYADDAPSSAALLDLTAEAPSASVLAPRTPKRVVVEAGSGDGVAEVSHTPERPPAGRSRGSFSDVFGEDHGRQSGRKRSSVGDIAELDGDDLEGIASETGAEAASAALGTGAGGYGRGHGSADADTGTARPAVCQDWKAQTWDGKPTLSAHKRRVSAIAFSAALSEGKPSSLFSTSVDGSIKMFEMPAGRQRRGVATEADILASAVLPNDKGIILGLNTGELAYFGVAAGRVLAKNTMHDGPVSCIDIDAKGKSAATGSWDMSVLVWDIRPTGLSREPVVSFYDSEERITSIAISPDGRTVVSGTEAGIITFLDVRSGAQMGQIERFAVDTFDDDGTPSTGISSLAWSANAETLVAATYEGYIVHMLADTRVNVVFEAHEKIADCAVSSDGNVVASCGSAGVVRLWDATVLSAVPSDTIAGDPIDDLLVAPDTGVGVSLPCGGGEGACRVSMSSSDDSLAAGMQGGDILVWHR